MSSRPQLNPFDAILNGDMSGNITSEVTIIQKLSMISYDISWSGSSPVGVISVEVSNTYSQNADGSVRNPGNWTTLTLSAPTNVSGSTGNGFIDIDATAGYAVRLVYTRTSGSGVLNVKGAGKVQ
jgi:hypothetical protein